MLISFPNGSIIMLMDGKKCFGPCNQPKRNISYFQAFLDTPHYSSNKLFELRWYQIRTKKAINETQRKPLSPSKIDQKV